MASTMPAAVLPCNQLNQKMRILVADDDPMQRVLLMGLLKGHGHEVVGVCDGATAWEHLERGGFNIVFTDWMMPGMNGLDLIRKLRAAHFERYVYIILCTGRDSHSDLIEGMKCGADDYIEKPFADDELMVRLAAGLRVITLEHRLNEDNRILAETHASLTKAFETIREDLEAAARMQRSLLPLPSTIHGIRCDSLFLPASAVAGDIFNFFALSPTEVGFYQLDVSGHGIPAAMLSVTLSKMLTSRPTQSSPLVLPTLDGSGYAIRPPHEAVAELNRRFQDQGDMYFTIVYGVLDKDSHWLRLSQAGHPEPILLQAGKPPQALGDGGFPVGVMPEMSYDLLEYQIEEGDRLFLSSDGILECANPAGEQFGRERLMEFLDTHRRSTLAVLLKDLEATMYRWAGAKDFADDVSLLALELGPPSDRRTNRNPEVQ
jgi:phosphoserine phosphatase RsbU/P